MPGVVFQAEAAKSPELRHLNQAPGTCKYTTFPSGIPVSDARSERLLERLLMLRKSLLNVFTCSLNFSDVRH